MSEIKAEFSKPILPGSSFLERFRRNPIILMELRGRMRGGRAFIVLTTYLLVLIVAISIVFFFFTASGNSVASLNMRQTLGKTIFGMVIGLELIMVSLIAPALTAGAIASEREQQTYDLLRTTLLPAHSLIIGKLTAPLAYLFLLLLVGIPLQSLSFLFGGVVIEEILIGNLILFTTCATFSTVGLFFSSFSRRTLISTVLAYAFSALVLFGLPILLLVGLTLYNSMPFGSNLFSDALMQTILILGGWLMVSLNPIATTLVTEFILIEEGSAIYFTLPLNPSNSISIISPWISFVILYTLLTLLLVWFSIYFVKRVEK